MGIKGIDVTPLEGGLYMVGFPPTPLDEILGFKSGKIVHVRAKNKIEAFERAKNLKELKKNLQYWYGGKRGTFIAFRVPEKGSIVFKN